MNSAINPQTRDTLAKMRQAAALSPYKGNAGNVQVADWLDVTGKYIDDLKRAEDRLQTDFAATVQDVGAEAQRGFWNMLALVLGLLTVTCAVAWFVVRSITQAGRRNWSTRWRRWRRARTTSRCPAPSVATRSATWRGRC